MIKILFKFNLMHLYLILAAFLLAGLFIFNHQPKLQFEVLVVSAICYVVIALTHHHLDKSLTLETFIEYILIALLIIIIVQGQLL